MPGGCEIGKRPIDVHIKAFKKLGVSVKYFEDYIIFKAQKLPKGKVYRVKLKMPSVGATENIIQYACKSNSITIIENCAREPEIVDLARFINSMGGKVFGAGYETIVVYGVKKLHGTSFRCIGDRISAGTFLIAGAMCGGRIELEGIDPNFLLPLMCSNSFGFPQ
jgi:UDP-N-acetylglucosamine 1-carboxyvinyltransferase